MKWKTFLIEPFRSGQREIINNLSSIVIFSLFPAIICASFEPLKRLFKSRDI